jgi:UDP-N-acetylmuramate dehydrogenase
MNLAAFAADLEARLPGRVTREQPVADLTTYRLGGPVAIVARVGDERELAAVADLVVAHGPPVLVVGRGSNLLVSDAGFAGLGIVLAGDFESLTIDVDAGRASAGGALPLPVLARRTAAAGLGGLEFFVGIPGSVGGAVRMNAGGHGRETREVLTRAWLVDLRQGPDVVERSAADLEFGYRHSNVTSTQVVTRADLAGTRDAADECARRIDEVVRWRREHQPGGANAGSVFRNPAGDSAGRLIDAAGLKGLRVGGASVSEKHANFFQADAGATAGDVHTLVREVQRRVHEHSGECLRPELHMVGFE